MTPFWFLPVAAFLHITEEFIFPGGFVPWYRNYKPSVSPGITVTYLAIVNAVLVIACLLPLALGPLRAVALWLAMASVVFVNALFHIRGTIQTRQYSPGVFTSVVLYIPLSLYGYWFVLSRHYASVGTAVSSAVIGPAYWWFSSFNHSRRARTAPLEKSQ
jgi:hypothetical protein